MKTIYVTAQNELKTPYKDRAYKSDVKTYQIDFAPWAEDNATVTSVTWTVESGDVAVSGNALSSNVATANITMTDTGKALVKIQATAGSLKKSVYLDIKVNDPDTFFDNDYGIC